MAYPKYGTYVWEGYATNGMLAVVCCVVGCAWIEWNADHVRSSSYEKEICLFFRFALAHGK